MSTVSRGWAIIRNAAVWGGWWGAAACAIGLVALAFGAFPRNIGVLDVAFMATRFGIAGGIAGVGFAVVLPLLYRGRRVHELSVWRFAAWGSAITAIGLPLAMQTFNVVSGDGPVPFREIDEDIIIGAIFGAMAAGGSLALAKRALPEPSAPEMLRDHADVARPMAGRDERVHARREAR